MLNVASFNIFWYPASQVAQNKRDKEDEGRIAHVLKNLAADVVVFQEILDIAHLENLVKGVRDSYSLRKSPEGDWLASGSVSSTKSMKIACAYDTSTLELVRGAGLEDPVSQRRFKGRRYPYALHLRHRDTGWEFTVVGVHFKSGLPVGDPPPNADDDKRMDEVEYLAGWLAGDAETGTGNFERPPTTDVIVIGDFNAVENHHSLSELRKGVLEPWYRPEAKVLASLGVNPETLEDTTERWTTYLDRVVIDHVITSPNVKPTCTSEPCIYAFDLDAALDEHPSPEGHWLRRETSYKAKPYGGASYRTVPNLYRISDHRPLRISIDPN